MPGPYRSAVRRRPSLPSAGHARPPDCHQQRRLTLMTNLHRRACPAPARPVAETSGETGWCRAAVSGMPAGDGGGDGGHLGFCGRRWGQWGGFGPPGVLAGLIPAASADSR
ncbi:hypothetical protein CRV15_17925 [Streptomyces clavuligerus]|nr:hypothetical protein D1794_18570 [Streptomyces clavuligerus]QCS07335.1 hypothetical protein CRV15_17925 [Streptomyces clavuligerus]QPJ93317.1 hypothetical protein GE265_10145 [Streptomyces clavuligerus]